MLPNRHTHLAIRADELRQLSLRRGEFHGHEQLSRQLPGCSERRERVFPALPASGRSILWLFAARPLTDVQALGHVEAARPMVGRDQLSRELSRVYRA